MGARATLCSALAFALLTAACASEVGDDDVGVDDAEVKSCRPPRIERKVDFEKKRALLTAVQRAAADDGVPNAALLIAGIGAHETGLAMCYSEARHHCAGPHSSDCGGPILAGSADGPCSSKQGGLGIFQFDAGNHTQTIAKYGKDILSVAGQLRAGTAVILEKLRLCPMGPRTETPEATKAWLARVKVDTPDYETFLDAMARCYNGAGERSCRFSQVRASYDAAIHFLLEDGTPAFWYPAAPAENE